ncbi:hypothetical protein VCRA2113O120_110129 [Vibrio crassostreae]|nr:hypothetical protein VCRA2113O120_110129 [Vibrio crassostreae]CAK1728015.1 hypothetical protein VCRA2114E123_120029 [Vibrio crassostreae]CAK1752762.1 hypothetical protein VCRA2113O119_130129 [Vibrio crassostreae]CAK2598877.1 hypothetical protein VCRA2119O124_120029 [Vibrio crassostreae]CAK2600337.1 hypothetical protein VCRA2119O125_120029 [Vibrio crassostreae]
MLCNGLVAYYLPILETRQNYSGLNAEFLGLIAVMSQCLYRVR